ncbi:PAS domain-containing sensor histidine kinase [Leptolyngbya iicbica]|uniref:histidine kinase n=2 Tax=Cyanophyceae TaxID=3028117 RepID=A0A4Q7E6G6_9CYAN|nr:ATP-binding protein [Leptolyngbya sp. LK]RZM76000.1 PAS domain-containing protein [Leptolyngbya sp. LK]
MVSFSGEAADPSIEALKAENEHLTAQVETLEQLLEVYEQETLDKSTRLETTLAELNEHTQRLSHAETTLATLRSMLNSMGDAVVVMDLAGKFLFLNAPAEALLGIRADQTSLQAWSTTWEIFLADQVTPCDLASFPLSRVIQGEALEATELFIKSSPSLPGNWFSVTARALTSAAGDREGGIAVFHNITPLKQGEIALRKSEARSREQAQQLQLALQDLQTMQSQLVQTEKMSSLGQLVAGIAHEINNPVNFISGNLDHAEQNMADLLALVALFQQYYPDPELAIQDYIDAIDLPFIATDLPKLMRSMKVGSERIQAIVASLRTFSRMDEADMKSVDIHSGIDSTLMILQNRLKAGANAAAIEVVCEYGQIPTVECYAGQLNQVFMNVLSNAIDALEGRRSLPTAEAVPPQITIQTILTPDQQVNIHIHDNGPGIPDTIRQQIFDPFFTTKPVGKGTGMGLSISYQIITEKHGGRFVCESIPQGGTTFTITIPLSQS